MGDEPLASLLASCAAGREAAFRDVVVRFREMAVAVAYGVLGDAHLAEDAAQEAFVAAWRALGDLRDPAAFPAWFRRIVVSQAHRVRRRSRRSGEAPLEEADGAPGSGGAADPAAAAEVRDRQARVRRAVQALPEPQRLVVLLRYAGGRSVGDIADALALTVPAVKNRLHAARRRLRADAAVAAAGDAAGRVLPRPAARPRRAAATVLAYRVDGAYYAAKAEGLARAGSVPAAAGGAPSRGPAADGVLDLAEARRAIAHRHGFAGWQPFLRHIEVLAAGAPAPPFMAAYRAMDQGDVSGLARLVAEHPFLANARGTNGNTLLNLAAGVGGAAGLRAARALLEAGADPDLANDRGWTPLHQAGYRNDPRLAAALLAAGADARRCAYGDGGTPLVQSLFWGHREAAALLAAAGVFPVNLRVAAGLGRVDLLAELVPARGRPVPAAGAHRAYYRPHTGFPAWTPSGDPQEVLDEAFVYACRSGRLGAMAFLLERGAGIDADPYRGTGLIWAAARGRADAVAWLLGRGADVHRRGTFGGPDHGRGVTALHLAAGAGHPAVVGLLLRGGADTAARDEAHGATPAEWAEHGGHAELARALRGT